MSQSLLFLRDLSVTGNRSNDSPEYTARYALHILVTHPIDTPTSFGKPFVPPTVTHKEIHAAIPKDLRKNAWLSAYYCV